MKSVKLRDLSLAQLLDMQGERFCDALLGEHASEQDNRYLNHLNRHVVWAMAREQGNAFLGVFKPRYEEMPLFRPWEGERLEAFSADFCVPTLDEELIGLVEEYQENRDPHRLLAIHDRIEVLGGVTLLWMAEDPPATGDSDDEPGYDLGEPW
jgi:hypothetical protein